jgi:hypothetical protein
VTAPGSVKLNEPKTITLHDFFLPVVLVELDDWPAIMVKRGGYCKQTRGNNALNHL